MTHLARLLSATVLAVALLGLSNPANAVVITLTDTGGDFDINRIIQGGNGGNIFLNNQLTAWARPGNANTGPDQAGMVDITTSLVQTALANALGGSAGDWQINSATFISQQPQAGNSGARPDGSNVATIHDANAYNPTSVTWGNYVGSNNANLVSGTHFGSTVLSSGSYSGTGSNVTITFDLTSTIQAWADGSTTNNNGLFFYDDPASGNNSRTTINTVFGRHSLEIDAERLMSPDVIPEPSSVAIWTVLGLCAAGFSLHRTRRKK